jgi:exopolyphosphatase/guanosine-5'-triphosphate,3'-diphosphate pyrophosphatase
MRTSRGALREGVLYDLIGRLRHEDVRERTVNALALRYSIDESTADIVEKRARTLFNGARTGWKLSDSDWELLRWTARCHEIGMTIAHKHFNRHSAYLLRNSELPGFSQDEQEQLALLALGHRGKPQTYLLNLLEEDQGDLRYLLAIIRLATCFKYVEQLEQLPDFTMTATPGSMALDFPQEWLQEHPLTAHELALEQSMLGKLGVDFSFR